MLIDLFVWSPVSLLTLQSLPAIMSVYLKSCLLYSYPRVSELSTPFPHIKLTILCGWNWPFPAFIGPSQTDWQFPGCRVTTGLSLTFTNRHTFFFSVFHSLVVLAFLCTGSASFRLFSLKIALVFRPRARTCWLSWGGILLCQEGAIRVEQGISLLQGCSLYLQLHGIKMLPL